MRGFSNGKATDICIFFSFYDVSIDSSSVSQEDKKAPSELSASEVLHQQHETDRRYFFSFFDGGKGEEGGCCSLSLLSLLEVSFMFANTHHLL